MYIHIWCHIHMLTRASSCIFEQLDRGNIMPGETWKFLPIRSSNISAYPLPTIVTYPFSNIFAHTFLQHYTFQTLIIFGDYALYKLNISILLWSIKLLTSFWCALFRSSIDIHILYIYIHIYISMCPYIYYIYVYRYIYIYIDR